MSTKGNISLVLSTFGMIIISTAFADIALTEERSMMEGKEAFIELNMSPDTFIKVNKIDEKNGIDRQPASVDFYRIRWPSSARGKVLLENGPHSFTIQNTIRVSAVFDRSYPNHGLSTFHVSGGMASQSDIYHDEARLRFLEFLSMLKLKGWQTYTGLNHPRLPTEQALKYALQRGNTVYSLPIDAEPNLETWMQINDNEWHMYAGNAIMTIGFKRDSSRLELDKPSAYYFKYEIFDKHELILRHLENDERERAAQIWPKRQKELQTLRYEKEALLVQQGYEIDTSYIGPELTLKQ